jgi:hypothetical protein
MSCALMFLIELSVPFLMLAPPPVCYVAGVLTIALMLVIMATGNYCFFNLLAVALSLLLFDDTVWRHVLPACATVSSTWPWWVLVPMALVLLVLCVHRVVYLFDRDVRWPRSLERLFAWLEPFHLVSGYGLFAVMTTTRPEIIVEGSDDGATWKAYEFKWKPGDPARPPRYCMPTSRGSTGRCGSRRSATTADIRGSSPFWRACWRMPDRWWICSALIPFMQHTAVRARDSVPIPIQ